MPLQRVPARVLLISAIGTSAVIVALAMGPALDASPRSLRVSSEPASSHSDLNEMANAQTGEPSGDGLDRQASEPSLSPAASEAPSGEPVPPVGVTPDPAAIGVLVTPNRHLPSGWRPERLVRPTSRFAVGEGTEKQLLHPEAAAAFDTMVAAASADRITIFGVSGFRSEPTQRTIFEQAVDRDGEATASTYSARPGHSEHQTGLAIDVAGADRSCLASSCFAGTPEAAWIEQHAHEFGFIVRYPEGAQSITGYRYEPWHLRFLGIDTARAVVASGLTYDEWMGAV